MQRDVARHVRECPVCQRIKVKTHKPYGRFKAVKSSDRLWEFVSMDWITDLPLTADTEFNNILVIMEMLSKRVILIACKNTMTAKQCADVYFERVVSQHGLQRVIFSDRDSRFTFAFLALYAAYVMFKIPCDFVRRYPILKKIILTILFLVVMLMPAHCRAPNKLPW